MKQFNLTDMVRYFADGITKNRKRMHIFVSSAAFLVLFFCLLNSFAFGDCQTTTSGTQTSDWIYISTTHRPATEACACVIGYCWSGYLGYYNTLTSSNNRQLHTDELIVGEQTEKCTGSRYLYFNFPCYDYLGMDYPWDSERNYFFIGKEKHGCTQNSKSFGSSADFASGNLYNSQDVFTSKGSLSTSINIAYNSLDTSMGPFGRGWTHNYNSSLLIWSNFLTVREGDGGGVSFQKDLSTGMFEPAASYGDHSIIVENADGTYTRVEKDGTNKNYDGTGRLLYILDRNGNITTLGYTGNDLTAITDSAGRMTTLFYDANNRVIQITGPVSSKIVTFSYTAQGYLSTVSDTLGNTWQYTYDTSGKMLTKTDPSNFTTTYTYDSNSRLKTSIDPEGKIKSISYNQSANSATITEKDGGVWVHTYDPTLSVPVQDINPLGGVTTYTYDSNSNRTSQTDPNGNTTTYTYDANGNMTSQTDPMGNTTTYEYNNFGEVTTMTDAMGNTTDYIYDEQGNLLTMTGPSGAVTQYTYDSRGNNRTVTNAVGQITTYVYDQYNNLTSVTDPSGTTTAFTYDISGNMIRQTDAAGNTSTYTYNALDQLTSITDPLGNITSYTYDPKGNMATMTDAEGNVTGYDYNYNNQQTFVTDAFGNVTTYTYGSTGCQSCGGGNDKLTAVTDAKDHTIWYEYDLAGRLTKMTDQLSNDETYTYYPNGTLHALTNRKGQTTTYTYDAANRMTRADYADSSYTTYAYDATNKITAITDSVAGTINYTYTTAASGMPVGLALTETTPLGSISYTYDAVGRRKTMQVAGQPVVYYNYDDAGKMTNINSLINSTVMNFNIGYDNAGRRTSLSLPNGVTTSYAYDNASRLSGLEHKDALNTVLESVGYTYHANGNRKNMNRQNVSLPQRASASGIYYNAANQMLTFTPATGSAQTMTYDDNGNMTSVTNTCGTTMYSWDVRNRLVGISGYKADCSSLTANFKYDTLGRRIEKTINGVTTQYVYDGLDIIQEQNTSGTVTVNYIRTLNIDEPLARINATNGAVRYYHADALGSIIALSDTTGQKVTQYVYDPFGAVTVSGEISDNPFQYTGRENDGTGLYYYRARYYSPELQRWVSEDPIRLKGGINMFAYVGNDPISGVDALGLACGSGWKQIFIPDNWFGWYSFEGPCSNHDSCYGCNGASAKKSKSECDNQFYQDMLSECAKLKKGSYWRNHCEGTASTYYDKVVNKGQPYFDAARKNCCKK